MSKRRLQFQYIADRNARKASLKKRKAGLLKKVSEITTLCGVDGCIIMYEPGNNVAITWPTNRSDVERVVERFLNTPQLERNKKMMDHEFFLLDKANKTQDGLNQLQVENRMGECDILMHQIYTHGRPLNSLNELELGGLFWFMNEKMNDVENKLQNLRLSGGPPGGSLSVPRSGRSAFYEVGQSSGENGNSQNEVFEEDVGTYYQNLLNRTGRARPAGNPNMLEYSNVAGNGNVNMQQPNAVGYGNNNVLHRSITGNNNNSFVLPPTVVAGRDNRNALQVTGATNFRNNGAMQGHTYNQNSIDNLMVSLDDLFRAVAGAGTGRRMGSNNMGLFNDPYAVINHSNSNVMVPNAVINHSNSNVMVPNAVINHNNSNVIVPNAVINRNNSNVIVPNAVINHNNSNVMVPNPYVGGPVTNAGNNGYPLGNPRQGRPVGYQGISVGEYQMGLSPQGGNLGCPLGVNAQARGGKGFMAGLLASDEETALYALGLLDGTTEFEMGMSALQGGIGNMEQEIGAPQPGYHVGDNSTIQVNVNVQNGAIGKSGVGHNVFGVEIPQGSYYPGESSAAGAPVTHSNGNAADNHDNEDGAGLYPTNNWPGYY